MRTPETHNPRRFLRSGRVRGNSHVISRENYGMYRDAKGCGAGDGCGADGMHTAAIGRAGGGFPLALLIFVSALFFFFAPSPSYAVSAQVYRGDIKFTQTPFSNLALKYPVLMIGGNYYIPMTEGFLNLIGLRTGDYEVRDRGSWSAVDKIELFPLSSVTSNSGGASGSTSGGATSNSGNSTSNSGGTAASDGSAAGAVDLFGETVDIKRIKPLVTALTMNRKTVRSNYPLYIIDNIPYLCVDHTNDIPITSAEILMKEFSDRRELYLPNKYSVFEKLPAEHFVKNQGSTQNCWAYAATSLFELRIALRENKILNFSEHHLVDHCPIPSDSSSGGNWNGSAAYFTKGVGPREEASAGETHSGYYLKEYEYVSGAEEIKKAIYENGGVLTSIYYGPERHKYYNADRFAYFHGSGDHAPTHELILIGWDDSYSKENFRTPPKNDGAFLAMNSFGTNFGQEGLFYISYEDDYAVRSAVTIRAYDKNHIILSKDTGGVTHYESLYNKWHLYAVVKFESAEAEGEAEGAEESRESRESGDSNIPKRIRGVGVFSNGDAIVTAYYSSRLPKTEADLIYLGDTYFEAEGYRVIENYNNIPAESEFYITLKYDSPKKFVVPLEATYPGIDYSITSEPMTSFIGYMEKQKLNLIPTEEIKFNSNIVLRLLLE